MPIPLDSMAAAHLGALRLLLIDGERNNYALLESLLPQDSAAAITLDRVEANAWALHLVSKSEYDGYIVNTDSFSRQHTAELLCLKPNSPLILLGSEFDPEFKTDYRVTTISRSDLSAAVFADALTRLSGQLRMCRELELMRTRYENYRVLVDNSSNLLWSTDLHGRWTYLNPAAKQIFGFEPQIMLGRPFYEFQFPEQAGKDLKVFKDTVAGTPCVNYETVFVRADGGRVHLSMNASAARDSGGQVIGVNGTASDITERKRAEEALRIIVEGTAAATAEKFFRSLVYHLAKVLETKYAFVGRVVGPHRDQVESLAVWWEDHYLDNFTYLIAGTPSETVIGKAIQVYTNDLYRLFPSDKHVAITNAQGYMGAPIFDSSGNAFGVVAVWNDQPLRDWAPARAIMTIFAARAGAEMERINVEEESRHLQRRLLQSQKMEAIGQLAAGVAHDLNNALGAVVGHLQLMRLSEQLNSELDRSISISLDGCERASSLIEQLLGFSRQGKYNLGEVSVRKAVSDTVRFLEKVIEKNVRIEIENGKFDELYVLADEAQLQQALINLIINAQQAMPHGGAINFRFAAREVLNPERFNPRAASNSYVLISVADTGEGIDPAHLDKIFEPFFTTKASGKGSGLGLSMVYGIAQNHAGWVEVDSVPGKGTVFTLFLPRVFQPRKRLREPSAELPPSVGGKILVIDDEPALVDLTAMFLDKMGIASVGFTAAHEALNWFRENHEQVDLVVLDMKMPGMNGAACFEELRKISPSVRVVLLSGYIQDETAQRLLERGALKFFQKPVKYPELTRWIAEQQKGRPSERRG